MKKLILLLVLTAIIGSFTYAVILRNNRSDKKNENIEKNKQEKKKKSPCAYHYQQRA